MTEQDEGRLARWSRLKTTGGASEAENSATPDVDSLPSDESSPSHEVPIGFEDLPDPANLPGGIQARNFVPPMTALADPEKSEEEGSPSRRRFSAALSQIRNLVRMPRNEN